MSTPTPEAMKRIKDVMSFWEHRGDRAYDEQDASTLIMEDGSLVAGFDRPFLVAACRAMVLVKV